MTKKKKKHQENVQVYSTKIFISGYQFIFITIYFCKLHSVQHVFLNEGTNLLKKLGENLHI